MAQPADLTFGLGRLPASSQDGAPDLEILVADVLKLIGDGLEVGATYLTRVDGNSVRIERVYDRIGMKLAVGDRLPLPDTSGSPLIVGSLRPLLIGPPRDDLSFASPTVKRDFGIAAYSGVLLYTSSGELYGTLGTLQTQARSLKEGEATLLTLAGRFIMHAIESQQAAESEAVTAAEPVSAVPVPADDYALQETEPALLVDLDGRIRSFNTAAEDLLAYNSDEMIGRTIVRSGLISPDSVAALLEALNSAMEGERTSRLEIDLTCQGGAALPAQLRFTPATRHGETAGVQITLRDLTEERRLQGETERLAEQVRLAREEIAQRAAQYKQVEAESARLAAERQTTDEELLATRARAFEATLRATLAASPLPIITLDAGGNVRGWNPTSTYLLGWQAEEVVGHALPCVAPESAERLRGIVQRASRGEEVGGEDVVYRRKDGTPVALKVTATPSFDGKGGIDGVLLTHVDESERKQLGDALRDVAARYLGLVEGAPDVLLITDGEGVIAMASRQAAMLHGHANPEAMVGLPFTELIESRDRDQATEAIRRALQTGEATTELLHLGGSTGAQYSGDARFAVLPDEAGRPAGVVVLIRDVSSQQAQIEQREQALEQARQTSARLEAERDELRAQVEQAGAQVESDLNERLVRAQEERRQAEDAWRQALAQEQEARILAEGALGELREADRDLVAMLEQERTIRRELEAERDRLLARSQDAANQVHAELTRQLDEERETWQQQEAEWRAQLTQEQVARSRLEQTVDELRAAAGEMQSSLAREQGQRTRLEAERDELLSRMQESSSQAQAELARRLAEEQEERRKSEAGWQDVLSHGQHALEQSRAELEQLSQTHAALEAALTEERELRVQLETERQDLRAQLETERQRLLDQAGEVRAQAERADLVSRAQEERRQIEADLQGLVERERAVRAQVESDLAEMRRVEAELRAALEQEQEARAAVEAERREIISRLEEREALPMADLTVSLEEERSARAEAEQARDRLQARLDGLGGQGQAADRVLQSVMSASPAAIIRYDPEGHVRGWNAASEQLFGWTQAEAMGMPLPLLPNERRQEFRALLGRVRQGETILDAPMRFRGKDTLWHDVRLSSIPVYDTAGNVGGIFTVLVEAGDGAERTATQNLRPLFDLSPDAVLQTDLQGAVIYANGHAAELFGSDSADALLGVNVLTLVMDPDRDRALGLLQRQTSNVAEAPQQAELMFERLEGPAFPAELTAAPAAGSEGHPVSLTLVIRDLSGRKQLEDTIDQLRRQNDALLEASGDGVVGIDLWGRVTFVNAGLQRLTGYSADELVGQSLHQVLHGGSDAAAGHSNEQCSLYAVLRERAPQQIHDESILSKGGNALSVDYSATPIRQGGKLAGAMIVVRPVRSPGIDQATPPVASNQDGLSALLASAPLPAAVTDAAGVYVDVNEAYCALLGYERSELTGTHFFSIIPENNRDKFATLYEQWIGARLEATDEHDVLTRDGRTITVLETSMPLGDNEVRSRVSFLLDVTARKAADQKAERAAQNDPITSLPSLPIFHDRLIQALAYANRHGQLVGLLHLDIDGFSQINDELGSNVGDLLLHEVAQRLETVTRDLDTVARIRGDDFVVILPDVGSAQNAATVARKILAEFARGFAVFGEPMTVTASIGISLFPFDGTEGDSLLASSEAGMYRAKEEGGNTLVFYGAGVD